MMIRRMNLSGLQSAVRAGLIATAALCSAMPAVADSNSYPLVELRQYTLHEGKRDVLIDLFEREFVESQETLGMKVIGTFTDLDRPNHFVWLRGFRGSAERKAGLTSFYGGRVWKAHNARANATMIDSDNVLLLRANVPGQFELSGSRPAYGASAPNGLIVATIYYLMIDPNKALTRFERQMQPRLKKAGIKPLAWFVTEMAPNNFPPLPVREGERVLVWFAAYEDEGTHAASKSSVDQAETSIAPFFQRAPETLRLKPTPRSLLRRASSAKMGSASDVSRHRPAELTEVAGVEIPQTPLAKHAASYVAAAEPDFLFNHSLRVFVFGALAMKARGAAFDPETAYVAALFHDLGLVPRVASAKNSFEIDGANLAEAFVLENGGTKEQARIAWNAVAMHDLGRTYQSRQSNEALLLGAGASADVNGPDSKVFSDATVADVLKDVPRLQFKERFMSAAADHCKRKPLSQIGWLDPLCREVVPREDRGSVQEGIAAAPFTE
ncbi:NIPSNAP family protein [Sphingopyxis fribergensis]|jgi:hypothetical protein